jgi:hypothetical protein
MSITYYKFNNPLFVQDFSELDLDTSILFSTPMEIPPDFSIDITPEGYRDKYTIETRTDPTAIREDTIARIKVVRQSGKQVSAFSYGPEGNGPTPVEIEAKESY